MRPASLLLFLAVLAPARAGELLPPEKAIEEVVDHYVDAKLKSANVKPAPLADDATFIRRVTLDLNGRIATPSEVRDYLHSADPAKKVKLVDRLLASSAFVRHQADEFDAMLSMRPGELRGYLTQALTDNKGWDQIFKELLLPPVESAKGRGRGRGTGAGSFLRQRVQDLDRLTNDVSVLFFGVNISCAQCHDHPKVEDWKQDHFFGMKSFFNRTFDNGGFVAERGFGVLKFKPNKGAEKQARMMFLTGKVVEEVSLREPTGDEKKKEKARLDEAKRKKQPAAPPPFSARARLVELALQPAESRFFARSAVNRLWNRYFGLGLVNPIDQMHSENPASHPELLTWLARDLSEHHYGLKRLTRGLVLSKAYARSSRHEGESAPKATLFAVARTRAMTPMQLALSLRLATADPRTLEKDLEKKLESMENGVRGFASQIEQPREDFQISVLEALLFSNSERFQREFLSDGTDKLIGRLKTMKNPEEEADLAVRSVLGRAPRAEELPVLRAFLQERSARPADAARDLVWALLTSSEFRFNH
jgi:hypothetical protein